LSVVDELKINSLAILAVFLVYQSESIYQSQSVYQSELASVIGLQVEMLVEGYNTSVILTGMSKLSSLDIIAGGSTDGIFYQSLNGVFHGTDEGIVQSLAMFSHLFCSCGWKIVKSILSFYFQ